MTTKEGTTAAHDRADAAATTPKERDSVSSAADDDATALLEKEQEAASRFADLPEEGTMPSKKNRIANSRSGKGRRAAARTVTSTNDTSMSAKQRIDARSRARTAAVKGSSLLTTTIPQLPGAYHGSAMDSDLRASNDDKLISKKKRIANRRSGRGGRAAAPPVTYTNESTVSAKQRIDARSRARTEAAKGSNPTTTIPQLPGANYGAAIDSDMDETMRSHEAEHDISNSSSGRDTVSCPIPFNQTREDEIEDGQVKPEPVLVEATLVASTRGIPSGDGDSEGGAAAGSPTQLVVVAEKSQAIDWGDRRVRLCAAAGTLLVLMLVGLVAGLLVWSSQEPPSMEPMAMISMEPSASSAPSLSPTVAPSWKPSTPPSEAPSTSPTQHPSSEPSTVPSTAPSLRPTAVPSSLPSAAPLTLPPTRAPTNNTIHLEWLALELEVERTGGREPSEAEIISLVILASRYWKESLHQAFPDAYQDFAMDVADSVVVRSVAAGRVPIFVFRMVLTAVVHVVPGGPALADRDMLANFLRYEIEKEAFLLLLRSALNGKDDNLFGRTQQVRLRSDDVRTSTVPLEYLALELGFYNETERREPTSLELEGLKAQTIDFYEQTLQVEFPQQFEKLSLTWVNVTAENVTSNQTAAEQSPLKVALQFHAYAYFFPAGVDDNDKEARGAAQVVDAMDRAAYNEFITNHCWESEPESSIFRKAQFGIFFNDTRRLNGKESGNVVATLFNVEGSCRNCAVTLTNNSFTLFDDAFDP